MAEETPAKTLMSADIARIMKLLPHRYPFLSSTGWLTWMARSRARRSRTSPSMSPSSRAISRQPVMPGVLLIEAMAQAAGALVLNHLGDAHAGKLVFFMSIDKARFRKPVLPGDVVHFHVKLSNKRAPVWKYWAEAHVDGKKVAEAEIGAMLMNER